MFKKMWFWLVKIVEYYSQSQSSKIEKENLSSSPPPLASLPTVSADNGGAVQQVSGGIVNQGGGNAISQGNGGVLNQGSTINNNFFIVLPNYRQENEVITNEDLPKLLELEEAIKWANRLKKSQNQELERERISKIEQKN